MAAMRLWSWAKCCIYIFWRRSPGWIADNWQ